MYRAWDCGRCPCAKIDLCQEIALFSIFLNADSVIFQNMYVSLHHVKITLNALKYCIMDFKTYSYEFHKWFNRYFHLSVDGKFKGLLYLLNLLPARQFELFMIKFDKKLRGVRGRYREEAFKTDVMRMRVHGHSITIYSY